MTRNWFRWQGCRISWCFRISKESHCEVRPVTSDDAHPQTGRNANWFHIPKELPNRASPGRLGSVDVEARRRSPCRFAPFTAVADGHRRPCLAWHRGVDPKELPVGSYAILTARGRRGRVWAERSPPALGPLKAESDARKHQCG